MLIKSTNRLGIPLASYFSVQLYSGFLFGWVVEYVVREVERGFFSAASFLSHRHVLFNPASGVILVRF